MEKDSSIRAFCTSTTNPYYAIAGLLKALEYNLDAFIEVTENKDALSPITIINPLLDNPFNWTHSYGTQRNEKAMAEHPYLNDTERDLTYNWTCIFTDSQEAIRKYQEEGIITPELIPFPQGGKYTVPVRIADIDKYRENIDGYKEGYFVTYWRPIDGIPIHVPDPKIGKVYEVRYYRDSFPLSRAGLLEKAGKYLLDIAASMKQTLNAKEILE